MRLDIAAAQPIDLKAGDEGQIKQTAAGTRARFRSAVWWRAPPKT